MTKTIHQTCKACGTVVSGFGVTDLESNYNAHMATVHGKKAEVIAKRFDKEVSFEEVKTAPKATKRKKK